MVRAPFLAACATLSLAGGAAAHPHIFVDTGLRLIHDAEGRVTALEILWRYDELFSLLLLEDIGFDQDYDGVLTEEETAALQGFDLDWPDWFEGDVYAFAADAPVALGPPEAGPAYLMENGMLSGVHFRALERPVDPTSEAVVVKMYDPTFYTAYSILPADVTSDAPGCRTTVFTPDLDAAYEELAAALAELGADMMGDPFEMIDMPPVGDKFAEEVHLTCAGG